MLDVTFAQATHLGNRANNEDAMGSSLPLSPIQARNRGWLFALADGVGGMDCGEVASAKAIQTLCDGFAASSDGSTLSTLLPRLIQQANAAVHDESLQPERGGARMATTVVACALRHDHAYVAHVGDSRCYLIRDSVASQITRDHTLVNEQRKLGILSEADAESSNSRHVLVRSLGPELFVAADSTAFGIRPADRILLCSDGLYAGLRDLEIARLASQSKDLNFVVQELVDAAVAADGSDNTSALMVEVRDIEAMAMYRGRLYRLPTTRPL